MLKLNIPLADALVIGHCAPDGDSLSSIKAVINYLRKNKCKAYTLGDDNIPEHLDWIINDKDIAPKKFKPKQLIVLDCAPTQERTGTVIPDLPIFNIDHHISRIKEHNGKNIFILNRCSTASALVMDFNIIDELLLVGLYTDTLFRRCWNEMLDVSKKLNISDERAEEIFNAIRPVRYFSALVGLKNAKIHKCRNGFFIVETGEKDPVVISEMADTMFRYAESICLIDGLGYAKLRTSNKRLIETKKLLEIADIFGGGGHPQACGMLANGKRTTLISVLKQLDIEPNSETI